MLRAYISYHVNTASGMPYAISNSTILSGMLFAEQILRQLKNLQVCLAWDATVVNTLAPSYVAVSVVRSQAVSCWPPRRVNSSKYAGLWSSHIFVPKVIETLGPVNETDILSCLNLTGAFQQSQTISGSHSCISSIFQFLYRGLTRSFQRHFCHRDM